MVEPLFCEICEFITGCLVNKHLLFCDSCSANCKMRFSDDKNIPNIKFTYCQEHIKIITRKISARKHRKEKELDRVLKERGIR